MPQFVTVGKTDWLARKKNNFFIALLPFTSSEDKLCEKYILALKLNFHAVGVQLVPWLLGCI